MGGFVFENFLIKKEGCAKNPYLLHRFSKNARRFFPKTKSPRKRRANFFWPSWLKNLSNMYVYTFFSIYRKTRPTREKLEFQKIENFSLHQIFFWKRKLSLIGKERKEGGRKEKEEEGKKGGKGGGRKKEGKGKSGQFSFFFKTFHIFPNPNWYFCRLPRKRRSNFSYPPR